MNAYANQLREAMQSVYGAFDWALILDGQLHRGTAPGDRPGSNNLWYVVYTDGIPSGAFGSWKIGDYHTWSSRSPTDRREAEHLRQQMGEARRQREAELRQRQQATAEYARRLWRDARRADPNHPYLTAKAVRPHALRQQGDALLIPLTHNGDLVNVQRIQADGSKRFLSGGRVKGCCSPLGMIQPGEPLYLCEGWATGATLHESTPGKTAAIKAAETLCCGLILPPWEGDEPLNMSDFNDLHQWREGQR